MRMMTQKLKPGRNFSSSLLTKSLEYAKLFSEKMIRNSLDRNCLKPKNLKIYNAEEKTNN